MRRPRKLDLLRDLELDLELTIDDVLADLVPGYTGELPGVVLEIPPTDESPQAA